MTTLIQRSFAAGEIAPALYGRVDQVKYATGLRTCRNFLVMRHGGVSNRPGTTFVGETKGPNADPFGTVRLVPWVFNNDQTYVLEFGDLYMRVIRNGGQVLEANSTITNITQAAVAVVTTSAPHGYSNGQEVYITGVLGMTQVNGRNFKVANVAASTFELQYMDAATNVNSTGFTAYASGGTAARVFTLVTPYVEEDLPDLQFAQSADVMTIAHPNYAPRELTRTAHTSWTLTTITFEPAIARPANEVLSASTAGTFSLRWKVTAVVLTPFEESLPGRMGGVVVTAATNASPASLTTAAVHGMVTGDEVFLSGFAGGTWGSNVNGNRYIVTVTGVSTFTIAVNSTGFGAYTASSGSEFRTAVGGNSITFPSTIGWDVVPGAAEYNVYRKDLNSGIFGFVGIAASNTFTDVNAPIDQSDSPPGERNPFPGVGDFPSTVIHAQQRRIFANTDNDPETVFASRVGNFRNFTTNTPIQADDAVTFGLAGREVNAIKHLIEIGTLVVLTSGGEWAILGNEAGILTPVSINAKQNAYNGSAAIRPLVVGGNALYVQARGSIVRDLLFDVQVDGYRGNDLTIFSAHLVDAFTIRDWAYQQIPHSIVWSVRSDGTLLGLTYVREHELVGWHRHDFDGIVEQVAVVAEGNEDFLYAVIKRTVTGLASLGGSTRRYIERFRTRRVGDIKDSIFVDSSLSFDGRNTTVSHTMTLTGGTTWVYTETLTLTSSAAFFTASDVGNAIFLTGADGTLIRCTITAFTSPTVVSVTPNKTVPVGMRAVAISTWARAVDEIGGLWHLEGKSVSVFGDGFVVANPNNAAYVVRTVTNGIVTLDKPYSVIHAGLPITSDLETLDMDTNQGETLSDKKKLVNRVALFVESSRGIWIGGRPPTDDAVDPLENLTEHKPQDPDDLDDPPVLETRTIDINIKSEWNSNGRVFVRQIDPVPLSILAVAPSGLVPLRG
jgi:hypothetical protein